MTTRNSKQQILQEQQQQEQEHVNEQDYLHLRRIPQLYCNDKGRLCCFICQKTYSKIQLLEFATHLHQHRTNMLCVFSEKERMAMRMSSFLNQLRTRTFIETNLANGADNAITEEQQHMEIISPLANLPERPPLHLETNAPLPNVVEPVLPQVKSTPQRRGRPVGSKMNYYVEHTEIAPRAVKAQAVPKEKTKKHKEEFDSEITSEEESEEYINDGATKKRKINANKSKVVTKKNTNTNTPKSKPGPKKKNSEDSIYKKKEKPPKEKVPKKKTLKRGLDEFLVDDMDENSNDSKSFDSQKDSDID